MSKAKVHYLFSRNKKIGSRLISFGTSFVHPEVDVVPSHVAVLVNDRWVFESTLESGVRRIEYKKWLEINEEVAKVECKQKWELKGIIDFYRSLSGKKYDYIGVTYFSWRVLLYILFKIEIPKENKFNHDSRYFCSEVVGKMTGVDYEMTAPVTIMLEVQKAISSDS